MKLRLKNILFILVTVFVIPGILLYFLERSLLPFYLIINASTIIPYYMWAAKHKLSCRILGWKFRF
jgi:hypothetical protein